MVRPLLEGLTFNQLSMEDMFHLEEEFTMGEVKGVVWECNGEKCSGQNSINFELLKRS